MGNRIAEPARPFYEVSRTRSILDQTKIVAKHVTIGALISGGFLAGVSAGASSNDYSARGNAKQALNAARPKAELASRVYDTAREDASEGCLLALKLYLDRGILFGTPENTVVEDMIDLPSKPCGEFDRDVRAEVHPLLSADADNTKKSSALKEAEASFDAADEKANHSTGALQALSLIGAGIGAAIGIGTSVDSRRNYRNGHTNTNGVYIPAHRVALPEVPMLQITDSTEEVA